MSGAAIQRDGDVVSIHDPGRYPNFDGVWFDREWWLNEGARSHSTTGRGSVLMLDRGDETWVYRHYHRGGFASRLIDDQYFWTGAERSRPVREWRLLESLSEAGLPAPWPVAARAVRTGLFYRADILTVLLADTRPLSSMLGDVWRDRALWDAIGRMLAGFHRAGCDHPDLTAHNVLVDSLRRPFLVDFDNAHLKPAGRWAEAGMARFKRSLKKVSLETGTQFDAAAWAAIIAGYSDESA
jgi:3-deoxy-D-manno-octulosonic acid kinase